jgi:hypothetical protein
MKKIFKITVFLLMLSANLFAQYSTDWIRPADNINKTGTMIARDNLDNAIVTGYIQSNNIFTRKYDKFGTLQWEKISTSGIQSVYEKSLWVTTDNANNVFVMGYQYAYSSSQGDMPNAVVALKYNAAGNLEWKRTMSVSVLVGSSFPRFNLRGEVDSSGNLYIGTVAASPSGFILYKINPSGTLVFTKNSSANAPRGFSAMRLKANTVVMTGSSGTITNAVVVAFSTSGSVMWTKALTGRGGQDVEIDDNDNTYVLTSFTNQVSTTSGEDAVIYKLGKSGKQTWKKDYHFGGSDFPSRFTLVANKLSVIGYGTSSAGAAYFDWITFQTDANGNMLWNARYDKMLSNDEIPAFIVAKKNGEVFVTGKGGPAITSPTGSSFLRLITLKYGNTGATKWIDSVNVNGGFGVACTLASDSSLFVLSHANMTAYHFLDQTTTGTCSIPGGLTVANITGTSANFTWSAVSGASLYHLSYKPASAATWIVVSTSLPSVTVTTLTAGTTYEYAVEAVCSSGPSGYSTTQTFSTTGTGYCSTAGQSQALEYLSFVWIGGIMNSTGIDNGYGNYTHLSTLLTQGQTISGYLSGRVPYPEFENYCIWIDFNHDNDFTDAGERVVNLYSDFTGWVAINFTVPATALLGATRMRITMSSGASPSPCGVYARGETEDYTVVIGAALASLVNENNTVILTNADAVNTQREATVTAQKVAVNESGGLYPNPASDRLYIKGLTKVNLSSAIEICDVAGRTVLVSVQTGNNIDISTLKTGMYFIRVTQNKTSIYTGQFIKK